MIDIRHCDALELLKSLPDGSIDAVITDPPYPEIDRDYGRLTELQWMELMQSVVLECKRVLKPSGSAAMILQPNYESLGKMRLWLWKFMVWCGENWNLIQDVYWWNYTAMPLAGVHEGLLKTSIKTIVWVGNPDCFKDSKAVLWEASKSAMVADLEDRALQYFPSGLSRRSGRLKETALRNGGASSFNLLPISNANSTNSGGTLGHGAATPIELMEWWIKYISPKHGLVCDPFLGSGTTALACQRLERDFIGGDKHLPYVEMARRRIANADPFQPTDKGDGIIQRSLFE